MKYPIIIGALAAGLAGGVVQAQQADPCPAAMAR